LCPFYASAIPKAWNSIHASAEASNHPQGILLSVIRRPGSLTSGVRTGQVKALTNLAGVTVGKVFRAGAARYIRGRLNDEAAIRSKIALTY
jgi:hypothetical protein